MTDNRTRRTDTLTAAAKARSAAKTQAAEKAIRTLVKNGEPITFQAVGREAGVSHAFLYNHHDLRSRIEHLRAQARRASAPHPAPSGHDAVVLTLTAQIAQIKKQHRQEVQALQKALEQAHGENLDLRRELDRRRDAAPPQRAQAVGPS
jgi:hypothetical protein